MRQFGMLVGTFLLVYLVTPWLVQFVVHWLPVAHSERIGSSIAIIATVVVYRLLRHRYADKLPHV